MKEASAQYHVSPLDLLTPNILHKDRPLVGSTPALRAHRGRPLQGLLVKWDVMARVRSLAPALDSLSEEGRRQRVKQHERLQECMHLEYSYHSRCWVRPARDINTKGKPARMQSAESRSAFIHKALTKEWDTLGTSHRMHTFVHLDDCTYSTRLALRIANQISALRVQCEQREHSRRAPPRRLLRQRVQ